ncbi:MAG: hypothetical protein HOM11_05345 [Methylococcales bacterium]|jgi:predicted transcriptional regulator|nr:hypothetical protein [Methylococcales bacterium]MBT7444410.1 hypothetical protein [Methylococcales bacterium]
MKKSQLVHVQADSELVMRLKILAARRNMKMYELVDEALSSWLQTQSGELSEIADLMFSFESA